MSKEGIHSLGPISSGCIQDEGLKGIRILTHFVFFVESYFPLTHTPRQSLLACTRHLKIIRRVKKGLLSRMREKMEERKEKTLGLGNPGFWLASSLHLHEGLAGGMCTSVTSVVNCYIDQRSEVSGSLLAVCSGVCTGVPHVQHRRTATQIRCCMALYHNKKAKGGQRNGITVKRIGCSAATTVSSLPAWLSPWPARGSASRKYHSWVIISSQH